MRASIRLAVCLVMAATSSAVFADEKAATVAGEGDQASASTTYADPGPGTEAETRSDDEGAGGGSGEPGRAGPGVQPAARAQEGEATWLPRVGIHDYDDQMGRP
jgi:hypothetical protein